MAYALISWNHPTASQAEIDAIEAGFTAAGAIQLYTGLRLYDEDGPRWTDVMQFTYDALKSRPGMEAIVIMPARGARVGGWLADLPRRAQVDSARGFMNMGGSANQPLLLKHPGANPPDDWTNFDQWDDGEASP